MTAQNPLVSLVYSSSATHPFGDDQLAELLSVSRSRNSARDITGMLLYRRGEFVQILEGARSDVESLMATIGRDPRHRDIRVLLEEPLHERRFAEWTMGTSRSPPRSPRWRRDTATRSMTSVRAITT
ncbi:BLUF domain-containing protein [Microbacterium hydrocarbonoxydans]|uniref:Sensors of blue-light using FAD n=1 Tax=Microbacterium hydrocarbonoxydans TaxID=273678 RepID=A0A1H4I6E0_9MICO|nr:BLUF domain-containing protein [Microbacterium hydrocarbonoxydans]SEB28928.1 Sensors of blue-light using FAD [Microbacterium hydrocarbonoxydans]